MIELNEHSTEIEHCSHLRSSARPPHGISEAEYAFLVRQRQGLLEQIRAIEDYLGMERSRPTKRERGEPRP